MASFRRFGLFISVVCATSGWAAPVPVRFGEGVVHGFLTMSTLDGKSIADGDLFQTAEGDLVTSRLVFRFHDGSIQEEATTFLQKDVFSLLHYRLVQKGPRFPHPQEFQLDSKTHEVTVRSLDGKSEDAKTTKVELPNDLANGMLSVLLKNLSPTTTALEVSLLVATPKPRLVKLEIARAGMDPLSLGSSERSATRYRIKVKIGGIAGALANLLGKVPPDATVWILHEETPAFVRSESPLYQEGPMVRTELIAPRWAGAR